jgi:hypothetical protein
MSFHRISFTFATSGMSLTPKVCHLISSYVFPQLQLSSIQSPARSMNSTSFVKAFMTSRLSMEKYANNMRRKFLVSGQSLWPPARAQLVALPISASTLAPGPLVFLPQPLVPPSHIQTPSWEDLHATLPLTETETETANVIEAFSNEIESATEIVTARPRSVSVSVNAKGIEIANNVSPRGSSRTESRAIGPVGVLLDTLVVSR